MKMLVLCFCVIFLIGFSCNYLKKKDLILKENTIHLIVSDRMEKKLLESKNRKFDLGFFSKLYYGQKQYTLDKIKVRGQSALKYRRKCFYVNSQKKIPFYNSESGDTVKLSKFILSAMTMDFTYIENKLSHSILKELNLWEIRSFFVELMINNSHQGLYLVMDEPKDFLFKRKQADCIIRRYYDHKIDQIEIRSDWDTAAQQSYIKSFNRIYSVLTELKGEELYQELSAKMNLESYFRILAVNLILENGDYTDEVYFFSNSADSSSIRFEILPWDYDDIFSQYPHEIGRKDHLAGQCFGQRSYPTYDDYLKETNGRLLFSIEDDLDFAIVKDDYLYAKYLAQLEEVVRMLNTSFIQKSFEKLRQEIEPFYAIPEIINQSEFDEEPTSLTILYRNLQEKENRLIERINWIQEEIIRQRNSLSIVK